MKPRSNRFIVLGRAGLDLYPDPPGTKIEDAVTFTAALGGSSGNIAAGLARMGSVVSLLTRVSSDAVGRYTLAECARYGIETDYCVFEDSEARNTLALSETRTNEPQTVIYRNNAADFALTEDDVAKVDWSGTGGLIFTGTSLAMEPSRSATLAAIDAAKEAGVTVLFDVDYRAYSWASLEEAAAICGEAAYACDIIVGNDDEFGVLAGDYDTGEAFACTLARDYAKAVIYKMGANGAKTFVAGEILETGIYPVTPIKPTGAGDAFMAGLASGLAQSLSLRDAVLRGSAAAAIVVTRVGCAPAMPSQAEIADMMAQTSLINA
ncbi:MAG: PfkB family carbohydrate kinase [Pseudomonadota bacterium]